MMSVKFGSTNLILELKKVFVGLQSMCGHIYIIANFSAINNLIQNQMILSFNTSHIGIFSPNIRKKSIIGSIRII